MNTIETRTVTPQIKTNVKGQTNLGEHVVKVVPFTPTSLADAIAKNGERACEVFNSQMHIKFTSAAFVERTLARLVALDETLAQRKEDNAEGKAETAEEYAVRLYPDALEMAKDVAKEEVFDFPAMFAAWAMKERSAKDKREVLVGYDGLVAMVSAKWVSTPVEKRIAFLGKYKLTGIEPDAAPDAVKAQIAKQYRPAAVEVSEGDL